MPELEVQSSLEHNQVNQEQKVHSALKALENLGVTIEELFECQKKSKITPVEVRGEDYRVREQVTLQERSPEMLINVEVGTPIQEFQSPATQQLAQKSSINQELLPSLPNEWYEKIYERFSKGVVNLNQLKQMVVETVQSAVDEVVNILACRLLEREPSIAIDNSMDLESLKTGLIAGVERPKGLQDRNGKSSRGIGFGLSDVATDTWQ